MDIILGSLKVMVLGIGTVFAVLIGLVFIIKAMQKVSDKNAKPQSAAEPDQAFESGVVSDAENYATQFKGQSEDEELVAVIAAAVAASLHRSTHDIIVRSIKHVPSITPVWNRVGRQEQIATRL